MTPLEILTRLRHRLEEKTAHCKYGVQVAPDPVYTWNELNQRYAAIRAWLVGHQLISDIDYVFDDDSLQIRFKDPKIAMLFKLTWC